MTNFSINLLEAKNELTHVLVLLIAFLSFSFFLHACYNVKEQHSSTVAGLTQNTEQITAEENVMFPNHRNSALSLKQQYHQYFCHYLSYCKQLYQCNLH